MKKLLMAASVLAIGFSVAPAMADNHEGGEGKRGGHFAKMDTDGDGNISKAEFLANAENKFSKIDADGDGVVTKEEMKAAKKKMKERRKENIENRKERRDAKDASSVE